MFYEVILDKQETPNKCTIAPLAHRPDFNLIPVRQASPLGPLLSPILLHPSGQCLTTLALQASQTPGIACVDCVWRRLDVLVNRITGPLPTLVRIPDGFVTAYPRRNKMGADPDGGLATIEAIFLAAALLGHWDPTLLSAYYFGSDFISLNAGRLVELGVPKIWIENQPPVFVPRPKTSAQRRADRRPVNPGSQR